MLAKLTCAVVMMTGCSSSAPPKPAAESAAAESAPAVTQPAQPKVAEDAVIVELEAEYAKLVVSTTEHDKAIEAMKAFEELDPMQVRMDALIKARVDLLGRADTAFIENKHPPGRERLVELREKLARFEETLNATQMKFSDAQRALATAKLRQLQKEQAEMKAGNAKKR